MDPASLSLGLIPIIGGSIKLYRASQSRLKTFRHYSGEVNRVRKQFERQRQFFLNEVHLALRLVVDDESLVREMVDDGNHPQWKSQSLGRTMLQRLNENNCEVLNEIVGDIGKTIKDVKEGLKCFDCLEEARREVRPQHHRYIKCCNYLGSHKLTDHLPCWLFSGRADQGCCQTATRSN